MKIKMITKEDCKSVGSTNPFKWLRESVEILEKDIKSVFRKDFNVHMVRQCDIESFKRQVDRIANDHPNATVKASAFIVTKED